MSENPSNAVAVIGIDICKNSFHVVGLNARGAMALPQKWSRGEVEVGAGQYVTVPHRHGGPAGAHHLSRKARFKSHNCCE
jgi:transposase